MVRQNKLLWVALLWVLVAGETNLFAQQTIAPRPIDMGNSPNLPARRDLTERNLSLGAPRFVEPGLYNPFDHNGSPLGLLEREAPGVNLAFRYMGGSESDDEKDLKLKSNNLMVPILGFTLEDVLSSRFYYRKITDEVSESENTQLNLHNGGLDLGWGSKSKYFQMGLSAHFLMGEANDTLGNDRILFNIPKLDLSMGSQPHPTVRLGIHWGAAGAFDSLRSETNNNTKTWERIGDFEFPNYGGHIDVGDTSIFPALSNVSFNIYKIKQIGTWKQNTIVNGPEYQYNPQWVSGHQFRWKSTYFIQHQGMGYWPSVMIEQWNQNTQRYQFDPADNRDPYLKRNKCVNGQICVNPDSTNITFWDGDGTTHKWFYSGVNFGLGGFIQIFNYANTFAEWEIHSINHEGENDKQKFYNRILVGAEGNLHNIPQWHFPSYFELFLRGSFSTGEENSLINGFQPYQFEYFDRYTLNIRDRNYTDPSYYSPEFGGTIDWFSFNFGLGFLLHKILQGDIYLSLYNKEFLGNNVFGYELGTTLQVHL